MDEQEKKKLVFIREKCATRWCVTNDIVIYVALNFDVICELLKDEQNININFLKNHFVELVFLSDVMTIMNRLIKISQY